MIREPVSLSELARALGVNKSKLNFYAWKKLIIPVQTIGRTMLFEKKDVLKTLEKIKKLRKQGMKLDQIVLELKQ